MEKDQFLSGMPCCRYMLMKLKHKEDACCFTKFVVRTLHSVSMSANDICGVLAIMSTSLPVSHPLMGYDFCSFKGVLLGDSADAFVEKVLNDDTVASYSYCYEYCKTMDKSTKFCNLCSLSRYYGNAYAKEERLLVRYAAESMENLGYLIEKGIKDSLFHSVVDVHGSLRLEPELVEKPFVFSFCSLMWQKLCEGKGTDLYNMSYEERIDILKSKVLDVFVGKYGRFYGQSSGISESVCAIQVENILELKCPNKKEIDAIVPLLVVEPKDKKNITAGSSNIKSSNIVDFYTREQLSEDSLKVTDNSGSNGASVMEPDTSSSVSYEEEEISFEKPSGESSGQSIEQPDGSADKGGPLLPISKNVETADGDPDGEKENDNLSFRELGYVYRASSVLYDTSEKEGFLGVPIVNKAELEHFSLNLDAKNQRMLAMLESHTLRDKRLSVELVVLEDKKTYYLLLYSPKLHAYFHTNLKEKYVKDALSDLLTFPSVTKYCYYPYFVASYLMIHGIYIKGLLSLFSLSAMVYGQHNLLIDECLENMGAYKAEGGVHVKPRGTITSLPLLYMHCYCQVYQRLSKELTSKGLIKELEERNCFDVLLGRFYYQDLYAKRSAALFTLRDSVGYHFLNEELEYKEDGYVLTYTFKHLPLNLSHLLRELLCRMENKGYFKKYSVMITGIGLSSFSIFVVKKDMRQLDTLVDTTLVMFLRENELYGVRYSLNRKMVTGPVKK